VEVIDGASSSMGRSRQNRVPPTVAARPAARRRRVIVNKGPPALLATYFATTSMPSLRSSSWMRGAPHSGFGTLISQMSWQPHQVSLVDRRAVLISRATRLGSQGDAIG
jgi:hypothetical protein